MSLNNLEDWALTQSHNGFPLYQTVKNYLKKTRQVILFIFTIIFFLWDYFVHSLLERYDVRCSHLSLLKMWIFRQQTFYVSVKRSLFFKKRFPLNQKWVNHLLQIRVRVRICERETLFHFVHILFYFRFVATFVQIFLWTNFSVSLLAIKLMNSIKQLSIKNSSLNFNLNLPQQQQLQQLQHPLSRFRHKHNPISCSENSSRSIWIQ
jgi:hypothetical protein